MPMHEHGIARDLWKVVLSEAEKNNLKKITKIVVVLGSASGIEKEFLNHSFVEHIFAENDIAKDAVMEYEIMPLAAQCNLCFEQIQPSQMEHLTCPHCGANDIKIVSGHEAYVKNIEGE
jgi:hydrogenase nickel incorporation protein HypA/HybF